MKVIFVGMHNKPGMKPLDSKTMTGKVIDRIIEKIPIECIKTNLWDVDEFPKNEDKLGLTITWLKRVPHEDNDIVVLLGTEVKKWFHEVYSINYIFFGHPAGVFGPKNKEDYITNAVKRLNELI